MAKIANLSIGLSANSAQLTKDLDKAKGKVGKFSKNMKSQLAGAVAGLGLTTAVKTAVTDVKELSKATSELSTLGINSTELEKYAEKAAEMSVAFGSDQVSQINAYYQAVSAGASSYEDATAILAAANKLALGGVTDIETATDGLTTVMNAYGLSADQVGMASDTFFGAMKAGKTTVGELSSSLGKVAPLADKAGLSFQETNAFLASVTLSGVSTSEAVTGMKAALSNIIKPSEKAKKAADELGIAFDAQALKQQGLEGFLQSVFKATNGDINKMSDLFGSVEGLNTVLAVSAEDGKVFSDTLEGIKNASGATDDAVGKVQDSLDFKLNSATAQMENLSIAMGESFVPILETVLPAVVSVVEAIANFSEDNPTMVAALAGIAAIGVAMTLMGGPITLIVGALAGIMLAWDNWDSISEKFPVTAAIIETALSGIKLAITTVKDLFDAFFDLFTGEGTFGDRLKTFFGDVGEIILGIFKAPLNGVMQLMEDSVNALVTKIPNAFLPKSIEDGISLPRFATGGAVWGAGTGTSDSIPALLSNGEFVINAKQTAKHRALLEQINGGNLPGFATGGMVGGMDRHSGGVVVSTVIDAQDYADQINRLNREQIAHADRIRQEYGNAVTSGIISGFKADGIKGAIRNIANMIAQKFEQRAADGLMDALFGVQGSKSTGLIGGLFGGVLGFADGGMVPSYYSNGGFVPKGTDTVPAMLTPGEVILNAAQQKNVAGAMNNGNNVTINISGNVDQRAINQIKQVVASDPSMIHQLNENGKRSGTGLQRRR